MSADEDWPEDTVAAVFVRRAVDQVGWSRFPAEWTGEEQDGDAPLPDRLRRVHDEMVRAIQTRELLIGMRLLHSLDGQFYRLEPPFRSPEGWREALLLHTVQADVPGSRRRVGADWWVFVRRDGLERLCAAQALADQPVAQSGSETLRKVGPLLGSKSYPDAPLDAYLRELAAHHPEALPPTQKFAVEALQAHFTGLNREQARAARKRVYPDATKPGPKGARNRAG